MQVQVGNRLSWSPAWYKVWSWELMVDLNPSNGQTVGSNLIILIRDLKQYLLTCPLVSDFVVDDVPCISQGSLEAQNL